MKTQWEHPKTGKKKRCAGGLLYLLVLLCVSYMTVLFTYVHYSALYCFLDFWLDAISPFIVWVLCAMIIKLNLLISKFLFSWKSLTYSRHIGTHLKLILSCDNLLVFSNFVSTYICFLNYVTIAFSILFLFILVVKEIWCLSLPADLPYGWEQETDEKGQIIYVE